MNYSDLYHCLMFKHRIKFGVLFSTRHFEFSMNTIEQPAQSQTVSTHTEEPVAAPVSDEHNPGATFFVIGGVINITMILAYFIWAFGAWKKVDKRKGR